MRYRLFGLLVLPILFACQQAPQEAPPHPQAAKIAKCVENVKLTYRVETYRDMPVSNAKLTEGCTWRIEQNPNWYAGLNVHDVLDLDNWR